MLWVNVRCMEKNGGVMSMDFENLLDFLAEIADFFVSLYEDKITKPFIDRRKKKHREKAEGTEKTYDKENSRPVLKCSICNGEQVAGFKDIHTGKFEEIMLIRDQKDLELFMKQYGIQEITKEY